MFVLVYVCVARTGVLVCAPYVCLFVVPKYGNGNYIDPDLQVKEHNTFLLTSSAFDPDPLAFHLLLPWSSPGDASGGHLAGGREVQRDHEHGSSPLPPAPGSRRSPRCVALLLSPLRVAPLVRVIVKFTVKIAVCESLRRQHTGNLTLILTLNIHGGGRPQRHFVTVSRAKQSMQPTCTNV